MKEYIYNNQRYPIAERNESVVHHSIGDSVVLIGHKYKYENLVVCKIEHKRYAYGSVIDSFVTYYLTDRENYTWQ